jgi:hypothetical protein
MWSRPLNAKVGGKITLEQQGRENAMQAPKWYCKQYLPPLKIVHHDFEFRVSTLT